MKRLTIFKRKANVAVVFAACALAGITGCKKGTFDINNNNPNSATSVAPKYALSAAMAGTAQLMYNGNEDMLQNWMGYWTQSGAYTPSNTYVLYQMTSNTGSGNWDQAYTNLNNYSTMIKSLGSNASLANYKAIGMMMEALVFQRIVDLYNNAPYSQALIINPQFSYKYDDAATIYKSLIAKVDSAVAIIKANPSAASIGSYDVMFKGDMTKWVKFGNTLKLKMLMRQTQAGLGSSGVQAALSGYTTADFLGAGEDANINPGYSTAADNQENPEYLDVEQNAAGSPGTNEQYFRANSYAVNFYKTHNDARLNAFYLPNSSGAIQGRAYGSQNGNEANSVISAISGWGLNPSASEPAPVIPAFESLFLQAEAIQRGYIQGNVATVYNSAVSESFRMLGFTDYAAQAAALTSQDDVLTNYASASAVTPNPGAAQLRLIITQKWAANNSLDVLESYSDWRRLGIPTDLPVSIYPGNTQKHIPYRFPYPTTELSYNNANVPDGGTATESLNTGVFWMPK